MATGHVAPRRADADVGSGQAGGQQTCRHHCGYDTARVIATTTRIGSWSKSIMTYLQKPASLQRDVVLLLQQVGWHNMCPELGNYCQ